LRAPASLSLAPSPIRFAVLALRDCGGASDLLAQGPSAALAREAARIAGVTVIAKQSAFGIADSLCTPDGVARTLGANPVLLGDLRAASDCVQFAAQPVGVTETRPVWRGTVTAPAAQFFGLVRALTAPIARTAGPGHSPAPAREVDPEAMLLYLLGQQRRAGRLHDIRTHAEALFAKAVERDPGFADAWSELGAVLLANTCRRWLTPPRGMLPERDRLTTAFDAAERASALRTELAAPWEMTASAMGYLGSRTEFHRAAETAIRHGGRPCAALMRLGHRRRAVGLARREAELNPLDRHAQYRLDNAWRLVGGHLASIDEGSLPEATSTATRNTGSTMLGAWSAATWPASTKGLCRRPHRPTCSITCLMRPIEQRRFAGARKALDADPNLLAAAEVQHAPVMRDYFLFLMNAAPRPDPDAILARIDAGDGHHEMAAILFARIGAMRHASLLLGRMGAHELPVIHMMFGQSCAPLRQLDPFGRLVRRTGLAAFWSGSEQRPDFTTGITAWVGALQAPAGRRVEQPSSAHSPDGPAVAGRVPTRRRCPPGCPGRGGASSNRGSAATGPEARPPRRGCRRCGPAPPRCTAAR
jgi:TolB-like protein